MTSSARDQFSGDWLSLREPADHQARSEALLQSLTHWLAKQQLQTLRVIDFGSGRGSNMQYLAPKLPLLQQWLLLDHDAALLAQAQQRALPHHVNQLGCAQVDLRHPESWQPQCTQAELITASALIDIVSQPWLHSWVAWGAQLGHAFLVTLSVDGLWRCSPEHPDDDWIRGLFNAHQQAMGAFGLSLGPAATELLAQLLRAHQYQVELATSPWRLDHTQTALQTQLLQGWVQASSEQAPTERRRIMLWQQARQSWIDRNESFLEVGHNDLVALPPEAS